MNDETEPIEPAHEILMDDEDVIAKQRREDRIIMSAWFKRAARILINYKGNLRLALHAYCLAADWADLTECESAVDVAIKLFANKKKKAAVTKAVKLFQDVLDLKPTSGQRKESGRTSMSKARKKQLKR